MIILIIDKKILNVARDQLQGRVYIEKREQLDSRWNKRSNKRTYVRAFVARFDMCFLDFGLTFSKPIAQIGTIKKNQKTIIACLFNGSFYMKYQTRINVKVHPIIFKMAYNQ